MARKKKTAKAEKADFEASGEKYLLVYVAELDGELHKETLNAREILERIDLMHEDDYYIIYGGKELDGEKGLREFDKLQLQLKKCNEALSL